MLCNMLMHVNIVKISVGSFFYEPFSNILVHFILVTPGMNSFSIGCFSFTKERKRTQCLCKTKIQIFVMVCCCILIGDLSFVHL